MGLFSKQSSKKVCTGEHKWETGKKCVRICADCGKKEGDHDFHADGGEYGRAGSSQLFRDYICTKCGSKRTVKVSDSLGPSAGLALNFASVLGVGPEEKLNREI